MEEARYLKLADKTFKRVMDAFDAVDPDVAEAFMAADVLTIAFANGVRCVLNTQRPVRQLWCAARASAWHFDYDEASDTWVSDKNKAEDLFAVLARVTKQEASIDVAFR
ncbi:MAG: iron donor protein CyaY [Myxococcales bacterium]|nr:iron donor protein CyaY [Myxococcales bacterium]